MAGSLVGLLYFKAHACLASYANILRRNLNTTCITSKPWRVTSRQWIHPAYDIAELGGFWSKLPIKVEIKTTREVVSYWKLFVTVREKWRRTSKMTVPVREKFLYKKIRGAVIVGGRRLEKWTWASVSDDRATARLHQHNTPAYIRVSVVENRTWRHLADGRSCPNKENIYIPSCESLAAYIRSAAKLAFSDIKV